MLKRAKTSDSKKKVKKITESKKIAKSSVKKSENNEKTGNSAKKTGTALKKTGSSGNTKKSNQNNVEETGKKSKKENFLPGQKHPTPDDVNTIFISIIFRYFP